VHSKHQDCIFRAAFSIRSHCGNSEVIAVIFHIPRSLARACSGMLILSLKDCEYQPMFERLGFRWLSRGNFAASTIGELEIVDVTNAPYSCVKDAQRWSQFPGQFGGLVKVDSGLDYAANFFAPCR
jgi:hypothetical protein